MMVSGTSVDFEDGRLTIRRSGNVDFNLFRVWIMDIADARFRAFEMPSVAG